jgi:hypothetical protein
VSLPYASPIYPKKNILKRVGLTHNCEPPEEAWQSSLSSGGIFGLLPASFLAVAMMVNKGAHMGVNHGKKKPSPRGKGSSQVIAIKTNYLLLVIKDLVHLVKHAVSSIAHIGSCISKTSTSDETRRQATKG